ncbi:MAG TPA: hypothetical protein VGE47_08675 [Burkholderiaceae bacterium]
MLRPHFALFTAAVLLSACSSVTPPPQPGPAPLPSGNPADAQRRAEFEQSLQRWHGAELKELVAKLGPPTSTRRTSEGRLAYVYSKSSRSFSCVVGYVLDPSTQRISAHWFEGC